MKSTRLFVLPLMLLALLQACVEDDLNFPKEDPDELTTSLVLATYLNALSSSDDHVGCFDFIYPITIGYNNGIGVTVDNKTGLIESAGSQTSNFHIVGISYPFLVNLNGQLVSVENETTFLNLLDECDIRTLRDAVEETVDQCYDFVYPLSIFDAAGNETTIQSSEALDDFLDNTVEFYQPQFVYPIRLQTHTTNEQVTITNLFDLFQVLNSCEGCPDISYNYDEVTPLHYLFEAEISEEVSAFDWYVNGTLVKTGNPNDLVLEKAFSPGSYSICIKATTDHCHEGVQYCEELLIESSCPELFFEPVQGDNPNVFSFFAEFPNMNDLSSYSWYVNGDVVKVDSGEIRDNKLVWQFETGIHEVCIKAENPQCPEGAAYCETIAAGCLPLGFTSEQETFGYVLTPNFEGYELVTYIWKVFVNDQLVEEDVHEPRDEESSFILDELEPGVTYEVCLKQDGACLEQQACQTFTWQ